MMKSIKRLVLTGAAVTVMMSFAVQAMADDFNSLEKSDDFYSNLFSTVLDGIPEEAGIHSKPEGPKVDAGDCFYLDSNGYWQTDYTHPFASYCWPSGR
jgi:hypothetical protein